MEYLSLFKATEFCNYSQEYLSLNIRYGKLRAVKIGKDWFTTKEWLDEYLDDKGKYLIERMKIYEKDL